MTVGNERLREFLRKRRLRRGSGGRARTNEHVYLQPFIEDKSLSDKRIHAYRSLSQNLQNATFLWQFLWQFGESGLTIRELKLMLMRYP